MNVSCRQGVFARRGSFARRLPGPPLGAAPPRRAAPCGRPRGRRRRRWTAALAAALGGALGAAGARLFETGDARGADALAEGKRPPAEVAPGTPAGPADDAAIRAQQAAVYREALAPLAAAELSFVSRTCGLTAEERARRAAALGAWLDGFAFEHAAAAVRQADAGDATTLQQAFESSLSAELQQGLSAEQVAAYRRERQARDAYRLETAIDCYLAKLDQHVVLSAEQYAQVRDELRAHWEDVSAPPLHAFVHLNNVLPETPAARVAKHLHPEQRRLLRGIQQVRFQETFGQRLQIGGELPLIDDVALPPTRLGGDGAAPEAAAAVNAAPAPQENGP